MEDKESELSIMFPDIPLEVLKETLKKKDGKIEECIDALLNYKPPTSSSSTTSEDEDFLLAKKLQEELNAPPEETSNDLLLAQSLSQEDLDAQFAKQLMLNEMRKNPKRDII